MYKSVVPATVASLSLLCFRPVLLLVAAAIKLESHGPIFFVQTRIGRGNRMFRMLKFRTMRADADPALHRQYVESFIQAGARRPEGTETICKIVNDPRITSIGHFLRRSSLDEVPQLLNVLLGDMSVVGPRPPIPYEVEAYELWHRKRLDMKPGVTGLWQVSGRNRLPFEEMVRLDLFYIENWSVLFDLKIIFRTMVVVFRGDGY